MSEETATYTFLCTEVGMTADIRRQAIRDLLLDRKAEGRGATVAELADLFGVCPRQIRYDLTKLSTEPDYEPIVLDITYEWRML